MKILIVGDWHSELHEEAVYRAFVKLGHRAIKFAWHDYFKSDCILRALMKPVQKAQNKYMFGPAVAKLNRDLVDLVDCEHPDLIFIYRGSHVLPDTLRRLRDADRNCVIVGYNNDDPFSPQYPKWAWRHFLGGIPEYDLILAYRCHNIDEFRAAGAKRVELLRSWFVPERNFPVHLTNEERRRYECDVVFVGHYEDDGRLECLEQIARQGWTLRIFGHDYGWNDVLKKSNELSRLYPVGTVFGADYNKALVGAKVALCFLSKLNRDTYTRRCFEIPAAGTMLLSEYSDDLGELFVAGKEADYFRNSSELVNRLKLYINNDALRASVAKAGFEKVHAANHDVNSRMLQVLEWVYG